MSSNRTISSLMLAPLRWLSATVGQGVSRLYEAIEWLYHLRTEFWRVEGMERHSGQPLTILCGLRAETKNYALRLIFADGYRERSLGRFWLWNVLRSTPDSASDCSMTLVWTCDSHRERFGRSKTWFLIPDWVLGEVELPRPASATQRISRDLRKIRMRGLTCQVAGEPEQFDDFYHHMYVPNTSNSFGNSAYVYTHKQLKRVLKTGHLLLIEKEDRPIAGQLITYDDSVPHLLFMGIRDADRAHIKDGAGDAVYHFGLQFLEGRGFRQAHVGWTRPFLHDGVLRFKRKWSQVICDSRDWGFGLNITSMTPAVRSFLQNNPFIQKHRERLAAAVFIDADVAMSQEDVEQLMKDYFHEGLNGLEIYRLPVGHDGSATPVEVALPEHVGIRSLDLH